MLTFVVNVIFTVVALLGLVLTVKDFPFPQKFTWFVSFFVFFTYGLLHTLYELGGRYIVLFPALFVITSVVQTTGILALCISIYSHVNENKISAHWYSLPTGASPLTMLTQYVPSHIIQVSIVALFAGYFAMSHLEKGKFYILGLVLIAGSHFVGTKLDGFQGLDFYNVQNILMILGLSLIIVKLKKN
jgi:hypothetical protein